MVWIAIEYEPHEGGDVEGVFASKDKAIEFVKSRFRYPDKIESVEEQKADPPMFDRFTVFIKSPNVEWTHWKIEEWSITE